ncbi:MAG: hypothetical protein V4658_07375 [Bacteroidota bacterium]
MSRPVKYFFLSIFIILLSGSSQLSGQRSMDSSNHCAKQALAFPDFANIRKAIDGLYIVHSPLQKATYEISVSFFENEEDDDLSSFKKHFKSCGFPILLLTRVLGNAFSCDNTITPSYGHYSYTSSLGNIGLQVFRI